jgi:purine-binding chemotaxis protein CheW
VAKQRKGVDDAGQPSAPAERTGEPEGAATLSPDELSARLASLRPRDDAAQAVQKRHDDYLTFWIASDEYALPLARAREIVRYESITKLPDTPSWLRGVTNIRGTVIPVVDLAPRFGLEETPASRRAAILLIEADWIGDAVVIGLLVSAVSRVVSATADEVVEAPAFGTRVRRELLLGLLPVDGGFASILDVDAVLSPSELSSQGGASGLATAGPSAQEDAGDRMT